MVKVFCACGMFKVNFCHSVPLNGALQLSTLRPVFVDATNARRAQLPHNHQCAVTLWIYEKDAERMIYKIESLLSKPRNFNINQSQNMHRLLRQARFAQFLPI